MPVPSDSTNPPQAEKSRSGALTRGDRLWRVTVTICFLMLVSVLVWVLSPLLTRGEIAQAKWEMARLNASFADMCDDGREVCLADMVDLPSDPAAPLAKRLAEDTALCTALLGSGRNAVMAVDGVPFSRGVKAGYQQKLAASYRGSLTDPWGNPYQFLIGSPTDGDTGSNRSLDATSSEAEQLTLYEEAECGCILFNSAPEGMSVYIISLGPNGILDQGPDVDPETADDIGTWEY